MRFHVSIFLFFSITFLCCCAGGEPPAIGDESSALGPEWTCGEIVGPVNNGPGVCPDCLAELCVKIVDVDKLGFGVHVKEDAEDPTELCSLTRVVVAQGSTVLFDDALALDPVALEESFTPLGPVTPLDDANINAAKTIEVEGTFGRPSCD